MAWHGNIFILMAWHASSDKLAPNIKQGTMHWKSLTTHGYMQTHSGSFLVSYDCPSPTSSFLAIMGMADTQFCQAQSSKFRYTRPGLSRNDLIKYLLILLFHFYIGEYLNIWQNRNLMDEFWFQQNYAICTTFKDLKISFLFKILRKGRHQNARANISFQF